jgi:hypothetical protein
MSNEEQTPEELPLEELEEALPVEEEDIEEDDDFDFDELEELEDELPEEFDSYVKLRTTSGSPMYVPIDEPCIITELLERAQLHATVGTEFWVGGISVDPQTFEVGPGAEIVVVGSVKGA